MTMTLTHAPDTDELREDLEAVLEAHGLNTPGRLGAIMHVATVTPAPSS
jgi:hypothetical protein